MRADALDLGVSRGVSGWLSNYFGPLVRVAALDEFRLGVDIAATAPSGDVETLKRLSATLTCEKGPAPARPARASVRRKNCSGSRCPRQSPIATWEEIMMTGSVDSGMTDWEDRCAAVRAQLSALSEHELRVFVAYLAERDVAAAELPLAEFLAGRAASREETYPGGVGDPGIIGIGASGSTAPGAAKLIAGVDAPATAGGLTGLRERDARDEPDPAGEDARGIAALIESYRARRAEEGG